MGGALLRSHLSRALAYDRVGEHPRAVGDYTRALGVIESRAAAEAAVSAVDAAAARRQGAKLAKEIFGKPAWTRPLRGEEHLDERPVWRSGTNRQAVG